MKKLSTEWNVEAKASQGLAVIGKWTFPRVFYGGPSFFLERIHLANGQKEARLGRKVEDRQSENVTNIFPHGVNIL